MEVKKLRSETVEVFEVVDEGNVFEVRRTVLSDKPGYVKVDVSRPVSDDEYIKVANQVLYNENVDRSRASDQNSDSQG